MEKELVINGIKYVRYEEPKEYKLYDLVKYNGYKWIVIKVKNNKLTLMMKDCLSKDKMKKIFKTKYLTDDYDIKHSSDDICNDWNKTEIKRGLNDEFLKEFDKEDLIEMKTNYDEDKYSFDYIRIPTVREIRILDLYKIKPDKDCWLMSPSYFYATLDFAIEWHFSSTGILHYGWFVANGFGARPVITLKSDNLNIEKVGTV